MHRRNGHHDPQAKFLPFDQFHLAPLRDVTPDPIREAAQLARTKFRDREDLKLNTALNFIARHLGFGDGFSGYQRAYADKLRPFMEKHGLKQRADLVRTAPSMAIVSLQPRQVADRLFRSGRPIPEQLFTAYDVVWADLNDRYFDHNPWKQDPQYSSSSLPFVTVMERIAEAERTKSGSAGAVLEAAVAACQVSLIPANNLLGDQLLRHQGDVEAEFDFVPNLYRPTSCSALQFQQHQHEALEVVKFFRKWIRTLGNGWVRVLPFNDRLVFLQGKDGEYDFLFPGVRDEAFDHNPFEPYLRNGDVPKSNDTYHFRRWLYFHFDGWLEQEIHLSEISFYSGGGEVGEYPGSEEILKRHLELKGTYCPPAKTAAASPGFFQVRLGERLFFVSNLVSIGEFRQFMQDEENRSYPVYSREAGGVDLWEPVNQDLDQSLPAAVTWYDANAYAAWINRTKGLPVRLLTADEFDMLARPILQPDPNTQHRDFFDSQHHRICRFEEPAGTRSVGQPCDARDAGFQAMELRYIPESLVWKRTASGLAFLVSQHFGEWLNEEASAVNTLTLSTLCYPGIPPARCRFAAGSTGKYKSKKIGFRLCYLGAVEVHS